jgi:hypothetical protein
MKVSNLYLPTTGSMSHPTVTPAPVPNLVADTICRTVELGLSIDNAADAGDVTHLYCHPVTFDLNCPGCGHACQVRDHIERRLTDLPIAGHPSLLHVRVPRLICVNDDCEVTIFRASIPQAADVFGDWLDARGDDVPPQDPGRDHGRVHRLRESRGPASGPGQAGHGPISRRPPGRRQAHRM